MQKRTWKPVPFEERDLPALELFFKDQLPGSGQYGSMGLFHWRSVANYLMPGIINLIKDGDKIVASLSNTPKRLFVKGRDYLVAEIGDAYTDPQYQRQGMLALLTIQSTRDALDKGIDGVYSTPDNQTPSLPAFVNKANFLPHEDVHIKSLVLPIDIGPFVGKMTHPLIGHYAGSLYLTVVYAYSLAMKVFNRSRGTLIEAVQSLPEDWESFWDKSRQAYDFIFERNRQALTWRFFRNPNKYKFYIVKQEGEIVGYVVWRIVADADIKKLIIADYLFLPDREHLFSLLLQKILEDAIKTGTHCINAWCNQESPYYRYFKKYWFRTHNNIVLIWFQNDFAVLLRNGFRKLHFTISDSDNV